MREEYKQITELSNENSELKKRILVLENNIGIYKSYYCTFKKINENPKQLELFNKDNPTQLNILDD